MQTSAALGLQNMLLEISGLCQSLVIICRISVIIQGSHSGWPTFKGKQDDDSSAFKGKQGVEVHVGGDIVP